MHVDEVAERKVGLHDLKKLALEKLPEGLLREDILTQPDEVTSEQYLANCRVWLRLLRLRR